MLGLLEAIIDRTADVLERLGAETDTLSHEVFKKGKAKVNKKKRDLELVITQIGQKAELLTLVQESLLSMSRVTAYHAAVRKGSAESNEVRQVSRLIQRDAGQLGEHARGLSGRLDFLLNATLGLINLEQNDIFRRFSIISIVYLAPMLIGSIYGMNFAFMPELNWMFGYPVALCLMISGAVLPALYFRHRGWF
jgi:magnesium transporter